MPAVQAAAMDVLVVGGGGREHALCWTLDRAPSVATVHCTPGNAGIADVATRHPSVDPVDRDAVVKLARDIGADLVVVGPEAPLVAGVADALRAAHIPVFGPSSAAARIEGSKQFAKDVMTAAGVATARYWSGDDPDQAVAALDDFAPPYVVKADGLAAGKGVRICTDRAEAVRAIEETMIAGLFGDAGNVVLIEEYLAGPEVSVFAVCDGADCRLLAPAQDFKRAFDGDEGPNTGGMGAWCPYPLDDAAVADLERTVFRPVLAELAARDLPFVGVLYGGFVLTGRGPLVLEFNARFGDPETQVVLPRLCSDLGLLLRACTDGALADAPPLVWDERACVTVVLASGGYPGAYETGQTIEGLDAAAGGDAIVFHAGTERAGDKVRTAGGRVLAVSGLGVGVPGARDAAYLAADHISFDALHRREDIAARVSRN
ncbi:MAG TPA: phosphoribosylamine--glycine ligase [Euzebyales bacterium]|nr:phosphoribosylamine--glycine ligase [Euzebyales bacterium]